MPSLVRIALVGALLVAVAPLAAQDVPVYTDGLPNGFQDYSYGGGSNFANAAPTHSGNAAPASANTLLIEHDVTVGAMVSDRFTCRDAANQPRVAVLAHNDGQTGPGGTRGGELREFRYETAGGPRIVRASG